MLKYCILIFSVITILSCNNSNKKQTQETNPIPQDTIKEPVYTKIEVKIVKDLLFDNYTLEDTYPYKDTTRNFQWDKIRLMLELLDSIQQQPALWGILQNRHNMNGEAPLVTTYQRNSYKNIIDTFGVERFQSIPLFLTTDTATPFRYALDGSLVKLSSNNDTSSLFIKAATISFLNEWFIPKKYIKQIKDSVLFKKTIFVDRTNQNITTFEKTDTAWLVRSMNPATTGVHRPPYMKETPLGIFVLQEKKSKMIFLVDGTNDHGGFAPNANRFCNGAYIHGVPVNLPATNLIEYSASLGTTPRSHMCVRNATSHAKFIYDWAPTEETLIFIIE